MAANTHPFRRFSDPLLVPVDTEPTVMQVPDDFFANLEKKHGKMTSFMVVNPNRCWVRLRGTSIAADGARPQEAVKVTPSTGWLFAPGVTMVNGTQYPAFMSALAVKKGGIPAVPPDSDGFDPLEISYGIGS